MVSYGRTLPLCAKAAEELAAEGIEAEVIDLRSLHPYDWRACQESIRRTGRVLFVNEDTEVTNFGEHLVRRTVEELFYELHAPPRLLAGAHVPGHRARRQPGDGHRAAASLDRREHPRPRPNGALT